MKLWKYENGCVPRLVSRSLAALGVCIFAYFHNSTIAYSAEVAPFAKFTDGMLSKTCPAGWLGEACKLQSEGLTGHPEALSYPYDTCLWAGEIPRMGRHGQDWWRYEQTAYYVDGLLRLGYATGDESFIKKGEENIDYTLEHAAPDGHLGHPSLWDATRYKLKNGYDMWPLAVFFRAMKAKFDAAPDERIPAALRKNFLNYGTEHVSKVRNIVNVEGLLWTYAHTGDKRLLDLAEAAWNLREPRPPEKKNELAPKNCANNDAIHMHGVSYCEEMKVPMILYAYTGKKEYLNQAVNVERKLVRDHMLPDGCPTSAERTLGNSVHICHETCDAVDYTWSLGYFLETTGDAAYADRIERCVFNAGFGAIADDFRSLQYFSNVNQFIATSNSDHNPQNYGTTWMQYRPTHETECCAGNVNRIIPNYISRMWLKDKDGGSVAALYGPSEVDFGWAKIKEETDYPFDGKVVFRFSMAEPKESTFTYRVPGWCKGASVKVNGEAVAAAMPGSFATIGRRFADGDVIELDLPMDVCFEEVPRRFVVDGKDVAKRLVKRPAAKFANFSQGTVVTRGPLLFAYPIPTERTEDVEEHENMNGKKSANPDFKSWNLKPAGPFNYALAARRAEVVGNGDAGDGFFRNPAGVKLRVSMKRIDWKLDENRFTPDLPERPLVLSDDIETIELVPYGLTMLRLGVFPDVSQETFAATVWRGETALVNSERCADLSSEAFAKAEAATALKVEDLKRLKRELAVPCETNGWGQLVVRCQVNGVECRLLVDTGCTRTFFDMPFVERAFGRDDVRSVKDPRAAFSNIDSIRESGSALELHGVSMSISGVEFGGLDVTVIDGDWDSDWDEKDGILGLDVLGSVPTLVSVGDRKLVFNLRERKGFKSYTAGRYVPGGEYICSFFGIVNGKPVSFLLDTGGNMTQLMGGQGWQWKPGTKVECKVGDINGIRKVEMACGMPTSVTACDVDISLKSPLVKFDDQKFQQKNLICVDTLKDYDILVWDRYFYSVRPRDAKLREDVSPVFLDLDFDTTAAPDLKKWTRSVLGGARYMRNAVSAVAIYITSGWPVPRRVKVAYVDDDGAPPVRIADGTPADVYLNAKWFRENKDGDAAGTFFRALVQVMQGYKKTLGATEENCPKWLAEGIAEYAKCYIFDRYSGKRDYSCDDVGACRYSDSCRATASFLDFVERNHRGTLVRANAALRAHAFDDGTFWKEATGMTADELEKLWRVELAGGVATAAPAPMERKETE